jgi:signal transduction histidine kinase
MLKHDRGRLLLIASLITLTSAGHYLTPPSQLLWHGIFQRLYYLPVVLGAISFGWRGGVLTALACGLAYIPHIHIDWAHMHHYAMEQYAEIFMFFTVGGVTGLLSDMEKRRRQELQRTAEELGRVYSELQSTFEQVRRADRLSAIGQLAAGLAHEIRNPLASIDGAAEVIEAGASGGVKEETVRIIRQECARLNRLLSSLLDFSRPRPPELSSVDVRQVLESVIELVRHSAGKNVRFDVATQDGLPALHCDREQLAQVLMNLTLNASQAMPEGGSVRISAESGGGGIIIRVADEGTGIKSEQLEKIFDPFFTTKASGTGLGLAVVHQIVTRHGGTVAASQNQDRGMTLTVRLPIGPEENT